ncbi:DgyrCDS4341 [Dimorphilus gyrociliatus]|uniref:DgyrCDS4341 n=1 Tax=Dimorphilus gyrociliatus TaxID=2664684 RepID=A0A7I8VG90_9ANNE|nr:DgyrCDS4341 [Dimorphilus gyrociliatus]
MICSDIQQWETEGNISDAEILRSKILSFVETEESARESSKEILVKEYRKIIPPMLIYCFFEDKSKNKKARGLWTQRPQGWPSNVPFDDPNNGHEKNESKKAEKPKKDTLIQMYNFLKQKFKDKESGQYQDNVTFQEQTYQEQTYQLVSQKEINPVNILWDSSERLDKKLTTIKDTMSDTVYETLEKCIKLFAFCHKHMNKASVMKLASDLEYEIDCYYHSKQDSEINIERWSNITNNVLVESSFAQQQNSPDSSYQNGVHETLPPQQLVNYQEIPNHASYF